MSWQWKPWTERAWARHLELAETSRHYGSEQGWDFYWFEATDTMVFVHRDTSIEFSQMLTDDQRRKVWYGTELIENLHFINWMGGL